MSYAQQSQSKLEGDRSNPLKQGVRDVVDGTEFAGLLLCGECGMQVGSVLSESAMNDETQNQGALRETLGQLEFLRGVKDEHVDELAKLGRFVDFPEGTIIFSECEPASECYLIVDGTVLLEICGAFGCTPILTVGEGELLGWSPVLGLERVTSNARTLTQTRAIEFSGRQILTLCEQHPKFGYQFMRCTALALSKRLTATRLQLLDLFGNEKPRQAEGGV